MNTTPPLLQVIDLCFQHPNQAKPTLSGVNLSLHQGEIVLIAGATGSGKSTLLNCLAGIAPHHTGGRLSGSILFQQTDIGNWSVRQRSQYFCTVLQNVETQIFTDRVWDEFVFGLENWNTPADQIAQLTPQTLSEFGLGAQQHWAIQQLSAGQKQRLLLACLLAIGQPMLLLDEPLAYLDNSGVEQLLHLLRSRADQGQSVLLIEHRLDRVQPICDRAYRFEQGQLAEWQFPASSHGSSQSNLLLPRLTHAASPTPLNLPPRSTPLLLQTEHLSWGGYPVFPDLQVSAGETIVLQGDNGCGKTTLLKLLCGLLKPTTGRLELLGRQVNQWRVDQIARTVGFVLQNPNHQLFAERVQAEIQQPGVPASIADLLLEQLDLSKWADSHPQALSQGQKRRLALGAVLARQPRICLLDEIMVGQDPRSLALMLNALQTFTEQGGALLVTSHVPIDSQALNLRVLGLSAAR